MASDNVNQPNQSADNDAFVEVRDKDGTVMRVPLQSRQLLIGRSNQSGLQLNSNTVSRQHAELYCDPFGKWWLRDLGSRNGTVVNGEPVYQDAELTHGDALQIGRFEMIFHADEEDADGDNEAPIESVDAFGDDEDDDEPDPASVPRRKPIFGSGGSDLTATVPIVPIGGGDDEDDPPEAKPAAPASAAKIDTIHLSTLAEFCNRLSKTDDMGERLRLLCRLMVRNDYHGQSAVALRVHKNQRISPEALCQPQLSLSGGKPPHISRKLLVSVAKSESPVLVTRRSKEHSGKLPKGLAAIACPLRTEKDYVDVLHVTIPETYGTVEWMALVSLAGQQYMQTETALDARKQAEANAAFEQDLNSARAIQMGLVPREPTLERLDLTIGFEPCRHVGGDYADAVRMPDGRVLLLVADVCGKGLAAALVTSKIHTVVHTSVRAGLDVESMMNALNEHLCDHLPDSSFVTMIALALDPQPGEMICVNAGHPPAIVVDPAGQVRHLTHSTNLPLGIGRKPLTTTNEKLQGSELLMLYSDGLTEIPDESGQLLGVDQLGQYLMAIYAGQEGQPIELAADALTRELEELDKGDEAQDDRTFLMARAPDLAPSVPQAAAPPAASAAPSDPAVVFNDEPGDEDESIVALEGSDTVKLQGGETVEDDDPLAALEKGLEDLNEADGTAEASAIELDEAKEASHLLDIADDDDEDSLPLA